MGWNQSKAPHDHTQAFAAGLQSFVAAGTPLWSLMRNNHEAYQVYGLLKDQIKGNPAVLMKDLVRSLGWRFLAAGSGRSGACHVGGVNGLAPKLTGFSRSQEIADAIKYIRYFETQPEVALDCFTLRMLRVPWLRFEAFWLSSSHPTEDIIIPYAGFPQAAELDLLTLYPVAEFLEKVGRHAKPKKPDLHQIEAEARAARVKEQLYLAASRAALDVSEKEGKKADKLETEGEVLRHRRGGGT